MGTPCDIKSPNNFFIFQTYTCKRPPVLILTAFISIVIETKYLIININFPIIDK
jgi:hypothetical protein